MSKVAEVALMVARIVWPFAVKSNPERAGTIATFLAAVGFIVWVAASAIGGAPVAPSVLEQAIEASADVLAAPFPADAFDLGGADVASPGDVAPLDAGSNEQ